MELSFKNLLNIIFGKVIGIIISMVLAVIIGYVSVELIDKPVYSNTASIYVQVGTVTSSTSSTLDFCITRLNQNDFRNSLLNNQYSMANNQKNIEDMDAKEYKEYMDKIVLTKSSDNTKILVTFKSTDLKELKALTSEFIVKATATLNNELKINTVNILGGSESNVVTDKKSSILYALIISFVTGLMYIVVLIIFEIVKKPIRDSLTLKELGYNFIGLLRKTDENSKVSENDLNKDNLRNIRTNLDFDMKKNGIDNPCFLITTYDNSDKKTKIVYSIAQSFACLNKKILLIDGNLREASMSSYLKLNNKKGLADLINSDIKTEEVINKLSDNLDFIAAPGFNSKSTEILNDAKLKAVIEELKKTYSYIIFDTPSMNRCVDAQVLSQFVNATVILTDFEKSNLNQLDYVVTKFKTAEVKHSYIIINDYKNTGLNRFFTANYQY